MSTEKAGGPLAHFPTASDEYLRQVLTGSAPGSPAYETARALLEDRKLERQAGAAERQVQAADRQATAAVEMMTQTRRLVRATWVLVLVTLLAGVIVAFVTAKVDARFASAA
jgi:hypothetical protein